MDLGPKRIACKAYSF